jgi:hypothetical protein
MWFMCLEINLKRLSEIYLLNGHKITALAKRLRVSSSRFLSSSSPGATTLSAAGLATNDGGAKSKVDVLLALSADSERRNVHDLLANAEGNISTSRT